MGIFDKIKDAVSDHPDQVNQGIDKAGDFIDERTGSQYSGHVDQGQDFLKDQADRLDGVEGQDPAGQAPMTTEAPAQQAPANQDPTEMIGFETPDIPGGLDDTLRGEQPTENR